MVWRGSGLTLFVSCMNIWKAHRSDDIDAQLLRLGLIQPDSLKHFPLRPLRYPTRKWPAQTSTLIIQSTSVEFCLLLSRFCVIAIVLARFLVHG